jgi:hypothetical protein
MKTSSLLALIPTLACYPAVAHPTRVGSGFSVQTTLGMHVSRNHVQTTGADERLINPTFGINAALSVRDTTAGDEGIGVRLSIGTGFSSPIWQAYVELPRDRFGVYDAGVGVAVHGSTPRIVMPYAQVGRQFGRNRSWYTQQGFAVASSKRENKSSVMWIPTVAFSSGAGGGEASLFITGVVGGSKFVHEELCRTCADDLGRVNRSMLLMGVSWGQIVVSNFPVPGRR